LALPDSTQTWAIITILFAIRVEQFMMWILHPRHDCVREVAMVLQSEISTSYSTVGAVVAISQAKDLLVTR